jgi:DNA-binding NarL/FixJ family response regulator
MPPPIGPPLSVRENQICALVVMGKTNKTIASELKLSPGTVKDHIGRIFLKLRCDSRTALAVLYLQGASAKPTPAKPSNKPASRRKGRK